MPSNYSAKEIRRMEAKRRKRMRRWLRSINMITPETYAGMRILGIDIANGIARGIVSTPVAVDSKGRILWSSVGPKEKP